MKTRLDDLKISVAEILGKPGEHRDLELHEPLPGIRTTMARLADAPVHARLRVESVVEGILVTGDVSGETVLECARCLTEFPAGISVDLCEMFVAPGHEAADEDAYRIRGTEIDLEPMLRDAVTLSLPLNPVCRAACAGMCARCGRDLNAGPCDCQTEELDPRWAPLENLRDRLES